MGSCLLISNRKKKLKGKKHELGLLSWMEYWTEQGKFKYLNNCKSYWQTWPAQLETVLFRGAEFVLWFLFPMPGIIKCRYSCSLSAYHWL